MRSSKRTLVRLLGCPRHSLLGRLRDVVCTLPGDDVSKEEEVDIEKDMRPKEVMLQVGTAGLATC